jgi:hypothetical protein
MSYVKGLLGVVGTLGVFAVAQHAQALTLQDLVSGGTSITVPGSNEVYSNFVSGGNLSASDVTVNFTATGVEFTANWNTLTPGNDSSVISYTVTTTPGSGLTLSGSQLFFAGQVVVGNAAASVGETLTDASGNNYSMSVYYAGKTGTSNNLNDAVVVAPSTSSLRVVKSIDVAANGTNSFASLNFVENTYTTTTGNGGTPPPVPEPMTLALLPLALAGLGLRKKLAR